MELTTFITFVGCLCLCGCASQNKEPENFSSDHSLPDCEQLVTAPKLITYRQFRQCVITNSLGYEEGYAYKFFEDENGMPTARKMNKQFSKFSQDFYLENPKEVLIKFRAKKSSNARADSSLHVRLVVGEEHVFHLKKDPYQFSTTDTWENVEYNFELTGLDSTEASAQVYILAIEEEAIVINNVVIDIKRSNQQVDPIVTTPVDEVEPQSTQGHP